MSKYFPDGCNVAPYALFMAMSVLLVGWYVGHDNAPPPAAVTTLLVRRSNLYMLPAANRSVTYTYLVSYPYPGIASHEVDPNEKVNDPLGQALQAGRASVSENDPGLQGIQEVDPLTLENVPAGHGMHVVESENVPGTHAVHAVAADTATKPSSHAVHDIDPLLLENVPG